MNYSQEFLYLITDSCFVFSFYSYHAHEKPATSNRLPLFSIVTLSFPLLLLAKRFNMEQQPVNQLNIEISEEMAEGEYANLAIITHSNAEFVIDFVNVMPGTLKSRVKSRIIFTPMHAKRFMKALEENISRFEAANGMIQDLENIEIPMNFGGPTAQA